MKLPVVGLGAGGHAKGMIEVLLADKGIDVVGLLEADQGRWGETLLGVPILGNDEELPRLRREGTRHFFVGVGGGPDTGLRERVFQRAISAGMRPVEVRHPGAVVSTTASLGQGVTVLALAAVGPSACVGTNVLINTGAIVEHDCSIGDHSHVAIGARLAGGVCIGEKSLIGAGATVLPGVRIGRGAVVGAGSVVLHDVPDGAVAVGVPARIVEETDR